MDTHDIPEKDSINHSCIELKFDNREFYIAIKPIVAHNKRKLIYDLKITKLFDEVIPEKCNWVLMHGKVYIHLFKKVTLLSQLMTN